jgi:hypothetical protein
MALSFCRPAIRVLLSVCHELRIDSEIFANSACGKVLDLWMARNRGRRAGLVLPNCMLANITNLDTPVIEQEPFKVSVFQLASSASRCLTWD